MTIETRQSRRLAGWIAIPILFVLVSIILGVLNRPVADQLETVRRELAEAGYPEARVEKGQVPKEMRRCDVNQIKKPGFAYAWKTSTHSGLFCFRLDGRSNEVIID